MLKIKVLYLRYGKNDYPGSLERLLDFYSNNLYLNPEYLIIDNSLPRNYSNQESGFDVVGGNNEKREFSGWDFVLKSFNCLDYDLIHFVTSAFQELYDGYLDHFYPEPMYYTANTFTCLGHVDKYPESCQIFNDTFQSWIRTCFYFMSPLTLTKLGNLTYQYNLDILFSRKNKYPFVNNSKLSDSYKNFLISWLTGQPVYGVKWHSVIGLNSSDRDLFIKKCESIILEQTLSIRMRNIGIKILDIGYLYIIKKNELFEDVYIDLDQAEYRIKYLGR